MPTRVDMSHKQNKNIVPCGLEATSVFNDTFQFAGVSINRTDIAWYDSLFWKLLIL